MTADSQMLSMEEMIRAVSCYARGTGPACARGAADRTRAWGDEVSGQECRAELRNSSVHRS